MTFAFKAMNSEASHAERRDLIAPQSQFTLEFYGNCQDTC